MAAEFMDGKMYVVASGRFAPVPYPPGENTSQSTTQLAEFPMPRKLVETFLQQKFGWDPPPTFAGQWLEFVLERLETHRGFARDEVNCRINGRGPFQWECRRKKHEVKQENFDETLPLNKLTRGQLVKRCRLMWKLLRRQSVDVLGALMNEERAEALAAAGEGDEDITDAFALLEQSWFDDTDDSFAASVTFSQRQNHADGSVTLKFSPAEGGMNDDVGGGFDDDPGNDNGGGFGDDVGGAGGGFDNDVGGDFGGDFDDDDEEEEESDFDGDFDDDDEEEEEDDDDDDGEGGEILPTETGLVVAQDDRGDWTAIPRQEAPTGSDELYNKMKRKLRTNPEIGTVHSHLTPFFRGAAVNNSVKRAIQGLCRVGNQIIVPWHKVLELRAEGMLPIQTKDLFVTCGATTTANGSIAKPNKVIPASEAEALLDANSDQQEKKQGAFGLISFDNYSIELRGFVWCYPMNATPFPDIIESIDVSKGPTVPNHLPWQNPEAVTLDNALSVEYLCVTEHAKQKGMGMILLAYALADRLAAGYDTVFMEVVRGTRRASRGEAHLQDGFSDPILMAQYHSAFGM